jgi:periplasmic protein TonB
MLHPFVSTHAVLRPLDVVTGAFSVAAHASLIVFAVTSSGRAPAAAAEPMRVNVEHVHFVDARERMETSARAANARKGSKAPRHAPVDALAAVASIAPPLIAPIDIPTSLPDIDYSAVATESVSFGNTTESLARTVIGGANAVLGPGNAYSEFVVDKTVWPRKGNPMPHYPGSLERAGVEARFVVRFVVDSTGKVDPKQMDFPQTAERGFIESVKYALLRSRYFPAELGGVRVRQIVQQEFVFLIHHQ